MEKFLDFIQTKVAPKLNKFARNVWVSALQESLLAVVPVILIGSFATLFNIIRDWVPSFPDISVLSTFSFGLVSLFMSYQIAERVLEKKKMRRVAKQAGFAALALFLILISPTLDGEGNFIVLTERFGNSGMLCALLAGIYSAFIMSLFGKHSFFKGESDVPDFVKVWFDVLIPVTIIVVTGVVLIFVLNVNIFDLLVTIFMPLSNIMQSFLGFTITDFIGNGLLYSMGISTWLLYPVFAVAQAQGMADNMAAHAAGLPATMINNGYTMNLYLIGGAAATLALNIMFLFARSKKLKSVGRSAILPAICNINEPIVYGAMAFEPLMMIPMWIVSLVTPALTYIAMKTGLVGIPYEPFGFWYAPFPIAAYGTVHSVMAVIWSFFMFFLSGLIYYPFFKVYDKQCAEEEAANKKD